MPTPNPSLRREYKGAAAATTLLNPMTNTDVSFVLVAANNWPSGSVGKFIVTINRGQADEEKILCDSQTTRTVACLLANRGFDGTTAQAHAAGATVECTISAFDADEWNQHTNATTGVHGVATVAGLTETQTFTNKTLTAPTMTSPLVSGTWTADASGRLLGNQPWVRVATNAAQSVLSGVTAALSWATLDAGSSAMWVIGNPTRLVAPVAGKYEFKAALWTTNQNDPGKTTTRIRYLWRVNGATQYCESVAYCPGYNGACPAGTPHASLQLSANDYVELQANPVDSNVDFNAGDLTHAWVSMTLVSG